MQNSISRPFTLDGIGYTAVSASIVSGKLTSNAKNATFVKTLSCIMRLARRADSCRFRSGYCLLTLRNGGGFKIIRQHFVKRLGQSHLMGKVGLGNRTLLQIKQAKSLEARVNKFEFGSRMNLCSERAPLLGHHGALAKLLKGVDRANAHVGNSSYYHQVNLLRAQKVGGTALRDLCVEATPKKAKIASLKIDEPELERAKIRGLGYALLAINGNPDLQSSKLNRPDLQQASRATLLSKIGGADLALEALNRIPLFRPLDPHVGVTVTTQELDALRTAMANETVSYRWVDNLVTTKRDLQAVLDVVLSYDRS